MLSLIKIVDIPKLQEILEFLILSIKIDPDIVLKAALPTGRVKQAIVFCLT
jgi:hypothetical protein